jgi:hypothetical protein
LLLTTVRPVPIQRRFGVVSRTTSENVPSGLTVTWLARPGSVCSFFMATRPEPSEYSSENRSFEGVPAARAAAAWVSRSMTAATAGKLAKL